MVKVSPASFRRMLNGTSRIDFNHFDNPLVQGLILGVKQHREIQNEKCIPVQKLASAFLYISHTCGYLMGNMQNLWGFSTKIGSTSSLNMMEGILSRHVITFQEPSENNTLDRTSL